MEKLDKRCKHKVKFTSPFYLYIKYSESGIFYVKLQNGRTFSTKTTDIKQAYQFALTIYNNPNSQIVAKLTTEKVLSEYYLENSKWLEYDTNHGIKNSERSIKQNRVVMMEFISLLSDCPDLSKISKSRLHKLQDQLLEKGNSGKTVNNKMAALHRVFKQLVDKEIIPSDPFIGLRNCSFTKEKRLCFKLSEVKGLYKNLDSNIKKLSYLAICTGGRKTELENLLPSDLEEYKDYYLLHIRGTKTEYSDRIVPVNQKIVEIINSPDFQNIVCPYNMKYCAEKIGSLLGYSIDYIRENNICLHSFRKMYKTILTGANLNTTLVETLMGHTTHNQQSNNVERTYFVTESADLDNVYKMVLSSLEFLVS